MQLEAKKLKRNGQYFADQFAGLFAEGLDPGEVKIKGLKYRIDEAGDGCLR